MQAVLHSYSRMRIGSARLPLAKGIGWGLLGGLVATLVMDLILMGILLAAGLPALTCFSIVGDTVASAFSPGVVGTGGSIPLGIAAHYLIGPWMGAMFCTAASKRIIVSSGDSLPLKKVVVLAILYAEILSQPMLAMASILLRMTASELLQWFGGSSIMHMVWGCVLGVIVSRALRLPVAARPN